ncbi:MAG TPA: hypothetical protein VEG30_15440 [Terriglobales bacterium]|nr:hypothetical protein [Terriglobales bacterium]
MLLVLALLSSVAIAAVSHKKVLKRIVAPLRSNPFLQKRVVPCHLGASSCKAFDGVRAETLILEPERVPIIEDPSRIVTMQVRALHRAPFAHHWIEIETSTGKVTLGFGPATLPFIDAGQISLQDSYGNIERISGMHPLPVLGMPPLNYRYAKAPGEGHPSGKPIRLSLAKADTLVERVGHARFVGPYIPIFHDCRTFVCAVQAAAQGRSSVPCYLLLKGYW